MTVPNEQSLIKSFSKIFNKWYKIVALILACSLLLGYADYTVEEGALSAQTMQNLTGTLAKTLNMQIQELNSALITNWESANNTDPSFYTTQQTYDYVISIIDGYYCLQSGTTGYLLQFSMDQDYIQELALGNVTVSGGSIFCEDFTWDASIAVPSNVGVVCEVNGAFTYLGAAAINLNSLSDVAQFIGLSNGQVLTYNSTSGLWQNEASTGSGGGGDGALNSYSMENLTDVNMVGVTNGDIVVYQSGMWINELPFTASWNATVDQLIGEASISTTQITSFNSAVDSLISAYSTLSTTQISNFNSAVDSLLSSYNGLSSSQISNFATSVDSILSSYMSLTASQISNFNSAVDSLISSASISTSQITNFLSTVDSDIAAYLAANPPSGGSGDSAPGAYTYLISYNSTSAKYQAVDSAGTIRWASTIQSVVFADVFAANPTHVYVDPMNLAGDALAVPAGCWVQFDPSCTGLDFASIGNGARVTGGNFVSEFSGYQQGDYTVATNSTNISSYYLAFKPDGEIWWFSNSASYTINNAIAALPNGVGSVPSGEVYFAAGDYNTTAQIEVHGQLTLAGAGIQATDFYEPTGAATYNMFEYKGSTNQIFLLIENMELDCTDGGSTSTTSGDGIHIAPVNPAFFYDVKLENVFVQHFAGDGVFSSQANGFYTQQFISEYNGHSGAGSGLKIDTTSGSGSSPQIIASTFKSNAYAGITILTATGAKIDGCTIDLNQFGIVSQSDAYGTKIDTCSFYDDSSDAAFLNAGYQSLMNCYISDCPTGVVVQAGKEQQLNPALLTPYDPDNRCNRRSRRTANRQQWIQSSWLNSKSVYNERHRCRRLICQTNSFNHLHSQRSSFNGVIHRRYSRIYNNL